MDFRHTQPWMISALSIYLFTLVPLRSDSAYKYRSWSITWQSTQRVFLAFLPFSLCFIHWIYSFKCQVGLWTCICKQGYQRDGFPNIPQNPLCFVHRIVSKAPSHLRCRATKSLYVLWIEAVKQHTNVYSVQSTIIWSTTCGATVHQMLFVVGKLPSSFLA